jgi:hypothetical protein
MPGRRTRLTFVAAVVAAVSGALLVAGCGAAEDRSWQGEFTERLGSSKAVIEEAASELRSSPDQTQGLETLIKLGRGLDSRRESIKGLVPPRACEAVQEAGAKELSQLAYESFLHYKNGTPFLLRHLPKIMKEEISGIEKIEREAESCE